MAKKPSGLGRGYFSLLDDNQLEEKGTLSSLRLSQVEPRGDQPRKNFDNEALSALADSIASHGVLQPILVTDANEAGIYTIIAGERRWRASKLAGLTEIPAIIVDGDALKVAQLSLVENIQRENLNPLEESLAYRALVDNFGLTQEQIAAQMGKSRSAIANSLRLLDLPEEVLELLSSGDISSGHARALLGLRSKTDMIELAAKIVEKDLSVRATEEAVKALNRTVPEDPESTDAVVIDYFRELEVRAMGALGRKVKISHKGKNKTISFTYEDNDDLQEFFEKLCGKEFFEE